MPETAAFLLVEDSNDDVELLKRAFAKGRVKNPLIVVKNGSEAIDYLKGVGLFRDRQKFPLPRILLLDLKMPGLDGFDVLRWLREQPQLHGIRIIVLTSSDAVRDVNLAYQLGAHSFLMKPNDLDDLVRLTAVIQGYWVWTDVGPQMPDQPSLASKKMPTPLRQWTEDEKEKLFRDYFSRDPGMCPVCGRVVHMMLEHESDVPVLAIRCDCGNWARVAGKVDRA